MEKFTYGKTEIDFDALPETSRKAIVSRGLTHYFGNEQASKVTGAAKKHLEEHGTELADDERNALRDEFVAAAAKALFDGSIGSRTLGPKATPFEAAQNAIAREGVIAQLRKFKLAVPKKADETVTVNGEAFTMAQLVARRIANPKFHDEIVKAANARVKESAKMVAAVEAQEVAEL